MQNNDQTKSKIIQILKKMDEVFRKKGFIEYQERVHRIYKTINSIQQHSECSVSRLDLDSNTNYLKAEDIPYDKTEYTSEYLSVHQENQIEIGSNDKNYKLDLNELFMYIENELNIHRFVNESTSSSVESEVEDRIKPQPVKKIKVLNKGSIQKKLFKIELKLRSYIKEQEAFQNTSEGTPVKSQLATSINQLDSNPLPVILNSFFEDSEGIKLELGKTNQRHSLMDNQIEMQIEKLRGMNRQKNLTCEVPKIKLKRKNSIKVSEFDAEDPYCSKFKKVKATYKSDYSSQGDEENNTEDN